MILLIGYYMVAVAKMGLVVKHFVISCFSDIGWFRSANKSFCLPISLTLSYRNKNTGK